MNIDVVPDITMRGQDDPHRRPAEPRPPTVGQLAASLDDLAGRPADWWPLIRFDPARPSRTRLDREPKIAETADLWLTTWPPGYRAGVPDDHDPEVSTLVAGELLEVTIGPDGVTERPLRAGRVQVRGTTPRRQLHNPGSTYAITLHARPH